MEWSLRSARLQFVCELLPGRANVLPKTLRRTNYATADEHNPAPKSHGNRIAIL